MSDKLDFMSPIGRLVGGSLYEPQTHDVNGKLLTYASGPKAGQPRVNYYFGLAIPKGPETSWTQTPWGQLIYQAGAAGYPTQIKAPTFSWKVTDGDSDIPNTKDRAPCSNQGYPGHWVLNYSGSIAPSLWNGVQDPKNLRQLTGVNEINLGDYIQVWGNVIDNAPSQSPGVYLNHSIVALMGYGERITFAPDANSVGFGGQLPTGASRTPVGVAPNVSTPAPIAAPAPNAYIAPNTPITTPPPAMPQTVVQPHPAILTPPAPPAAPVKTLTARANGATYEQYIAAGWTDIQLIQEGLLAG